MDKITFEEFYKEFQIKRNTIQTHSPYENTMYDFGEEEMEYLEDLPEDQTWSLQDNGKHLIIVSGISHKNTIGYFVSKKPWLCELKYVLK